MTTAVGHALFVRAACCRLNWTELEPFERHEERIIKLERGTTVILRVESRNPDEVNSATNVYHQIDVPLEKDVYMRTKMVLQVLVQVQPQRSDDT